MTPEETKELAISQIEECKDGWIAFTINGNYSQINGNFSDGDALNFCKHLFNERPDVKKAASVMLAKQYRGMG